MFMGIEPIHMFPTPLPLPCGEGKFSTRRPHDRRGGLLAGGAALALFVERLAEAADDQPANRRGIAEANLGLGRMHVDVDLLQRNVEEQGSDWMAVARNKVAIGRTKRTDEQAVLHWPRIDEQILLVGHAAVEGRKADDPAEP